MLPVVLDLLFLQCQLFRLPLQSLGELLQARPVQSSSELKSECADLAILPTMLTQCPKQHQPPPQHLSKPRNRNRVNGASSFADLKNAGNHAKGREGVPLRTSKVCERNRPVKECLHLRLFAKTAHLLSVSSGASELPLDFLIFGKSFSPGLVAQVQRIEKGLT